LQTENDYKNILKYQLTKVSVEFFTTNLTFRNNVFIHFSNDILGIVINNILFIGNIIIDKCHWHIIYYSNIDICNIYHNKNVHLFIVVYLAYG
jgi:hypothetical protein